MKRKIQSIAYILFIGVSLWVLAKAIITYENPFSLYENPLVWILIVMLAIVILMKEYVSYTAQRVVKELQNEKQGIQLEEDQWEGVKKILRKFTKARPVEDNEIIELDHNYDGIKELDNVLPPWWVSLFYLTIIFGTIYLIRFEILGADNQEQEYNKAMVLARMEIQKYKASTPNVFDVDNVTQLTTSADLSRGKAIFTLNCASCHAPDAGGGIGPNLTDKHWILGGGFKNVFNTVYNGGRTGKGMISWKSTLKPEDIQKVASYVISLQGSSPAKPKAPQGELWKE